LHKIKISRGVASNFANSSTIEANAMGIAATKVLTWIASPFGLFLLSCALLVLAGPWRRRQPRLYGSLKSLWALTTLAMVALAWHPVASMVVRPLEDRARELAALPRPDSFAAILLLSGTALTLGAEPGGEQVTFDYTGRVWRAADLYHRGAAPRIIVTGGGHLSEERDRTAPSEAAAIRGLLLKLGVPIKAVQLEQESRNTFENIRNSQRLLGDFATVALVTSATHMPRAMQEARAAGLHAHAFPVEFRLNAATDIPFHHGFPSPGTLAWSTLALKEWLGLLVVELREP
jgi:uncharacterized SAM-binding protein YcdF (DUF218 family)